VAIAVFAYRPYDRACSQRVPARWVCERQSSLQPRAHISVSQTLPPNAAAFLQAVEIVKRAGAEIILHPRTSRPGSRSRSRRSSPAYLVARESAGGRLMYLPREKAWNRTCRLHSNRVRRPLGLWGGSRFQRRGTARTDWSWRAVFFADAAVKHGSS